jgi:hypothetical protein
MSPKPSPNDLTRQQLDELDGLLQRMLGLPTTGPVAAPDPPPAELPPIPGAWRLDRPAAEARPHVLEELDLIPLTTAVVPLAALGLGKRDEPDPMWGPDPLARYNTPVADARLFAPPTADTGVPPSTATVRGADTPALPHGFRSAFAEPPAPVPAPDAPKPEVVASQPSAPSSRVPAVLWPVFALNWLLETLLGLFGPLGTAAKHPAAKHLLGACGLLLLAAAGVWSARGMGWLALPFPR